MACASSGFCGFLHDCSIHRSGGHGHRLVPIQTRPPHRHAFVAESTASAKTHITLSLESPVRIHPSEHPQLLHGGRIRHLHVDPVKVLRILHARAVVVAFPIPEKWHDLTHVRTTGDIFQALVVNADRRRALVGFSLRIRDPNRQRGLLARLEPVLRGDDFHAQLALFRRQDDLAGHRVHLAVRHGHAVDEKVRHIAERDGDLHHLRLAGDKDDARLLFLALVGADEKPDAGVGLVHVDQQLQRIPGAVFLLVGDQLEVVVAEIARAIRTAHREHGRALALAAFRIRELNGHAILPRLRCLENPVPALRHPARHLFLGDLPIPIDAGFVKDRLRLALDGLPIERARREASRHLVTGPRIAAVQPDGDIIRLPRGEHGAAPHDGPPRCVHHLGGDRVSVILIAVDELRDRAVELHFHLAVGTDGKRLLKHQLRRTHAAAIPPPRGGRADAAPYTPARIPRVFTVAPPIAATVEPVPRAVREPAVVVKIPLHPDFHRRLGDRRTVVVVCGNGRLESLAQRHRLGRGIDLHLEFRLLVFLHPEGESRARHSTLNLDVVGSKRRLFLEVEVKGDAAIFIGDQAVLFENLLVHGIAHDDARRLSGKCRLLSEIIPRFAGPQLHVHCLPGAIDRPIGDADGLLRHVTVFVAVVAAPVETPVSEVGPALPGAGDDMPAVIVPALLLSQHQLAVLIGLLREMMGDDVEAPFALGFLKVVRLVPEKLQLARHRCTRRRIHEVDHLLARLAAFQDHKIPHPHHDPCGVPVLQLGLEQIGTRRKFPKPEVRLRIHMAVRRFQFLRPRAQLIAEISFPVLFHQHPSELGKGRLELINLCRIRFQVLDDVLHQQLLLRLGQGKLHGFRVPESQGHLHRRGGKIGRSRPELAPVSPDLLEQFRTAVVVARAVQSYHIIEGFRSGDILLPVQENLHQQIPRLRLRPALTGAHKLPQPRDELVVLPQGETLHTARQLRDRLVLFKARCLEYPVTLLHIRLGPPAVGRQRVHIVVLMAELQPLQLLLGSGFRRKPPDLRQQPAPTLAVGFRRLP